VALRAMTGGLGVDKAIEAAGVPATLRWALAALRKGGRIAAVGIPTRGVEIDVRDLVLYELELAGSRASAGEMRRVMPHVADGRMRLREVMTHEFALADFAAALATFRDPGSGAIKIVIKP
jgi:L-iditol 2-dehydrogenase